MKRRRYRLQSIASIRLRSIQLWAQWFQRDAALKQAYRIFSL